MSALRVGGHLLALHRAQRLEPERLRGVQASRLARLIAHAYAHVPYWRRLMDRAGIDPGDIRSPEDLHRLGAGLEGPHLLAMRAEQREGIAVPPGDQGLDRAGVHHAPSPSSTRSASAARPRSGMGSQAGRFAASYRTS